MKNEDFENETTLDEESSLSVSPDTEEDTEEEQDVAMDYDSDDEDDKEKWPPNDDNDGWFSKDYFKNEKQVAFVVTGHDGKDTLKNLSDDEASFFRMIPAFIYPHEKYEGLPKNENSPIDKSFIWRSELSNAIKYRGNEEDIKVLEGELPKRFAHCFTAHSVKQLIPLTREVLICKIEEAVKDKITSLKFYSERIAVIKFKSGREESLNRDLLRELCGLSCLILEKDGYTSDGELDEWPFDTSFYC